MAAPSSNPEENTYFSNVQLDLGYKVLGHEAYLKMKFPYEIFKFPVKRWRARIHGFFDRFHTESNREASTPTAFEQEIIHEREKIIYETSRSANSELLEIAAYLQRLRPPKFDAESTLASVKNQAVTWRNYYRESLEQAKNNYNSSKNAIDKINEKFETFATTHNLGLNEPPASQKKLLDKISFISALVVIEIIFNALFFLLNPDIGRHLNAIVYSVPVSASNTIIGVLTGMFGLYYMKNQKSLPIKLLAIAFSCLSFASIAILNSALSMCREDLNYTLSLNNILPEHPLSYFLFLFGFATFAYSAHKGYTDFGNDIPGYKFIWDKQMEAKKDYNTWNDRNLAIINSLRGHGYEMFDELRSNVTEAQAALNNIIINTNTALKHLGRLHKLTENKYALAESQTLILFKIYREWAKLKPIDFDTATPGRLHHFLTTYPQVHSNDIEQEAKEIIELADSNNVRLETFKLQFEKDVVEAFEKEMEHISKEFSQKPQGEPGHG